MVCVSQADRQLNYCPCRYGGSKLLFRGPKKDLSDDYIAFLGGTETYGKFVEVPFADIIGSRFNVSAVNLGCVNAGLDIFSNDQTVLNICSQAQATVLQVPSTHSISNRYYKVHPRRNDRFLEATPLLRSLFPKFNAHAYDFIKDMLAALKDESEHKFELIQQELQECWVAHMISLSEQISGKVFLLWIAPHCIDDELASRDVMAEPMFVERKMIEEVRGYFTDLIEISATRDEIELGKEMLVVPDYELIAAREILGPVVHSRAAVSIAKSLSVNF